MLRAVVLSSALLVTALLAAQSNNPLFTATPEQLDVAKVVLAQQTAWNAGDMATYLSYFKDAPDTEIMLGAPVRGMNDIRNAFRAMYPKPDAMGQLDDSEVDVRELGPNFALATGKYHITRPHKSGGDVQGTFSEVFEKTDAGWKVIFSESI